MNNIAEINVRYKARPVGEDGPASYSWSVFSFGAYADESIGCPAGQGLHTIAGALQEAMTAAIANGFSGARFNYQGASGKIRSLDSALRPGVVTIERARAAADALMNMEAQ